jgi:hypothetical protein
MGLFRRRSKPVLPDHVAEAMPSEESVRTWATGKASVRGETAYLIASERALYVDDPSGRVRIPWDRVLKAKWVDPTLEVLTQPGPGGVTRMLRFRLDETGEMPVVVRERVTASIVVTEHVPLDGQRGVRVVARSDSDTGDIRWSMVFDQGLDSSDPDLRSRADEALARVRSQMGI